MELRVDNIVFPEGKEKAFTLSYDDGVIQDKKFIELIKKYGLKATFNLNSGSFGQIDHYPHISVAHQKIEKSEVKELYEGFEVASHTVTHPDLVKIPSSMVSYEVSADKYNLEQIVGYLVRGFAYPMGTFNNKVANILREIGIEYARTTAKNYSFTLPEDFLLWHPTCNHDDERVMELLDEFLSNTPSKRKIAPYVFYLWGHTYEFDHNKNWDRIEAIFKRVAGQKEVWYATNIEIVDYINKARQLKYSANGKMLYNPTSSTIWLKSLEKVYKIEAGQTIYL